jgi:hypothetical protein
MTLPASGPISMTQVMAELRTSNPGRAFPISLGDSDVRALAGVPSGPISMSNLLGKASIAPLSVQGFSDTDNTFFTQAGSGTAYAFPTVQISGGSNNYTIVWTIISSENSPILDNANTRNPSVRKAYTRRANGSFNAYLSCTVTDNVTGKSVRVDNIQAYAEWSDGSSNPN